MRDESAGKRELELRSRIKPGNNELLIAGQVPDGQGGATAYANDTA
jgi:hypothetical protein